MSPVSCAQLNVINSNYKSNSTQLSDGLDRLKINTVNGFTTLDTKDISMNLPATETLQVIKTLLIFKKYQNTTTQQTILLLHMIVRQKYFQFLNNFSEARKCASMGSPVSVLVAEIFLQCCEKLMTKFTIETRHVDEIITVFFTRKHQKKCEITLIRFTGILDSS
jgi:hypothetical protein